MFYKSICLALTILTLFVWYEYIMNLWQNRQPYLDFVQTQLNNFGAKYSFAPEAKDHTVDEMMEFAKATGIQTLIFIGSLIFLSIAKKIWNATPILSSLIKRWDDADDLSHLLGRLICNHLRNNTTISNKDFFDLVNYSMTQNFYFNQATQNPNYQGMFKKYDGNYRFDFLPTAQAAPKTPTVAPTIPVVPKSDVEIDSHKETKPEMVKNTLDGEKKDPTL